MRDKKRILLKYLILFLFVAVIALRNIYNIEKEKNSLSNSYSPSLNQLISTNQDNYSSQDDLTDEIIIDKADLTPKDGTDGVASATISTTEGFFIHQVILKADDPPAGNFYEAWLYKQSQADYYPLGQMIKKDGNFRATNVSELNRQDYSKVLISLEQENIGIGIMPKNVIFEGNLERF